MTPGGGPRDAPQDPNRLVVVAATTGYQTRAFADAARKVGVEPVLATDRCHVLEDPWSDQAIPLRFEDPEQAAASVDGEFRGIVAVGDRPALIAALAAERLHLPFHPSQAVRRTLDKHLSRQAFEAAGLPTPAYGRIPLNSERPESPVGFPCVLKPLGLSASRGVIRADNQAAFLAAFDRIRTLLDSPDIRRFRDPRDQYVQVESFIEGREFALEGLVTGGRLQTFALFDKPDPLDGPFFEESLYITPSRQPFEAQLAILAAAQNGVTALGLSHGPVHVEMRVNGRGVWMLEAAARPIGGLCSKALRFVGGESLEEVIVRHALGEDVSNAELADAAAGVMMIPIPKSGVYQYVTGIEEAASVPGIAEVIITAKAGQKLLRLPEGASYLGFIFARADTADEVERALRASHSHLTFEIATTLQLVK